MPTRGYPSSHVGLNSDEQPANGYGDAVIDHGNAKDGECTAFDAPGNTGKDGGNAIDGTGDAPRGAAPVAGNLHNVAVAHKEPADKVQEYVSMADRRMAVTFGLAVLVPVVVMRALLW